MASILEDATITYKDGKITVKGKTFEAVLSVSSSELSKVYWGSVGKGKVKLTTPDSK